MTVRLGKISPLLTAAARDHRIVGAQLAAHHQGTTLSVQVGHEHHDGPRVDRASVFPLGSVTKLVNATVVMRLAAQGVLGLDTPIESTIRELRADRPDRAGLVTPRQLLSHTSGLPSDFSPPGADSPIEYAVRCRDLDPLFPPGSLYSYSNVGSAVAGGLVEAVTGTDWWTAVRTTLLDRVGADTIRPLTATTGRPGVSGHVVEPDGPIPLTPSCPDCYLPAGGLAGTAGDLVAIGRLLAGNTRPGTDLLDQDTRAAIRDGAPDTRPFGATIGTGLGVHRFDTEHGHWFGHDGSIEGTTCHLRFDPNTGTVIALLTNTAHGADLWADLVRGLATIGLAPGAETPPTRPRTPPTGPPDCFGDYHSGDMRYSVRPAPDGQVRIRAGATTLRDITFHPGLVFSALDPTGHGRPVTGRFLPDRNGHEITLLEVGGRVARREPVPAASTRTR